jgi:CRISPR-associated endonuclease/helicase Cas3
MFFAHSRPGQPESNWDPLHQHLERTAQRARTFFPLAPEWAYLAGLWHDVGKYQSEFQGYLHDCGEAADEQRHPKVKHSVVGAALASGHKGASAFLLQWVIAAHHGSLAEKSCLVAQVRDAGLPRLAACRGNVPPQIASVTCPDQLPTAVLNVNTGAAALCTRMLFSALTDADMLDTEAWDKGSERDGGFASLHDMRNRLHLAMSEKCAELTHKGLSQSPINMMRAEVLRQCLDAAENGPGQFTLTVPTGGGKTLSSMAFALRHACLHQLERIIVVIPYTSIIEQTAQTYRDIFGAANVIEHHSNVDLDSASLAHQRACENWDAPIIITTSVQFFESLYAARKSRCRKLHNIARSVVILDEVQTFPVGLLYPIRRVLGLLAQHFGTTVVHCTATQPTPEPGVKIGPEMNPAPRPIIADPSNLYEVVKQRFEVKVEGSIDEALPLEELADRVRQYSSVMAIVHNRKEAEQLARMVDGCWHLSARMCAQHRKDVLDKVRAILKAKQPCRLVATQLVEAGVDISFPVVFRALAGLETLAQAAGRCNRELDGELPGEFHIFRAVSQPPSNSLRRELAVALDFLKDPDFKLDLNDPSLFAKYFRCVLDPLRITTDEPGIAALEREMNFPEVEKQFHLIDSNANSVLAPYGDWKNRLASVREEGPNATEPSPSAATFCPAL